MSALPDLQPLFPIYRLRITLTLKQPTTFPFNHRYILAGYLRGQIAQSDQQYAENFNTYCKIDAIESGTPSYLSNADYSFDILLTNPHQSPQFLNELLLQIHTNTATTSTQSRKPSSLDPQNIKLTKIQNLPLFNLPETNQQWHQAEPLNLTTLSSTELPQQLSDYLHPITYQDFSHQIEQLSWQKELTLQWLSPVRLLKKAAQSYKGEQRYMADQDNTNIPRLLFYLANNLNNQQSNTPSQTFDELEAYLPRIKKYQTDLFWLHLKARTQQANETHCGGMLGEIQIEFTDSLSPQWQQILSYSQLTGIGALSSFGWGKYLLKNNQKPYLFRPPPTTPNILQQAFTHNNIEQTLQQAKSELKVAARQQYTHINTPYLQSKISEIQNQLEQEKYSPTPIEAWKKRKKDGSYRIITAPKFEERILQKALANILSQRLDQLFYQHSYGYRPQRSRKDAKDAIEKAIKQGYKWVFESDIKQFFETINHRTLLVRLHGLFPQDPAIKLIYQWIKAPYLYGQIYVHREKGLPQGSPLSPILSNIILDDFDNDLQKQGHRLIRYADDFIILSKNKQQSEQAQKAVNQSLNEHHLYTNRDKTNHISPEQSYHFLGYRFSHHTQATENELPEFPSPPPQKNTSYPLDKNYLFNDERIPTNQPTLIHSLTTDTPYGNTLIIQGGYKELNTEQNQLIISEKENTIATYPWQQIQSIMLIGKHQITTASLQNALEQQKNIYFLKSNGSLQGTLHSNQNHTYNKTLWLQQIQSFANSDFSLKIAQHNIQQKITQQHKLLQTYQEKTKKSILRQLNALQCHIKLIPNSQNITQLIAIEAKAARAYYTAYQQLIPPQYQFTQRNKRPPKDPINVLLSLGYTILYNYTDSLITIQGLNPYHGYMHQPRGQHKTLASDQMEPLRTQIDQTILKCINLKQIHPSDFYKNNDDKIHLASNKRKIYLRTLMQTLTQEKYKQDSPLNQIINSNKTLIKNIQEHHKKLI